jgi:hypothetical protein
VLVNENAERNLPHRIRSRLAAALKELEASAQDILMLRVYVVNATTEGFQQVLTALRELLGDAMPSITTIDVQAPYTPEIRVEIEMVACQRETRVSAPFDGSRFMRRMDTRSINFSEQEQISEQMNMEVLCGNDAQIAIGGFKSFSVRISIVRIKPKQTACASLGETLARWLCCH